ncbi:Voltage-gated Ion Channel (VIC) Superfamily, partial [Phytophthora palmivora]
MLLSVAQLQGSYYLPHWVSEDAFSIISFPLLGLILVNNLHHQREKRACAHRPGCIDTIPNSSFIVANVLRVIMAVLGLVRLFIRFGQLWKTKCHKNPTIRGKLYGLELIYTAIFPYPGFETFFSSDCGDAFVLLSLSTVFRSVSWGQLLYYPYPVRQKEKVASFSGNL